MLKKLMTTLVFSCVLIMGFTQSAFAARQPAMERALGALINAERALKRALPNKGGHRIRAIRHIRQAMKEVRKGIEVANRRPQGGELRQKKRIIEHQQDRRYQGQREKKMQEFRDRRQDQRERQLEQEHDEYDKDGNIIKKGRY